MGKSPGKWVKTVHFGKKSSKSNLSKDATSDKKISITINSQSNDFSADSSVISSPLCNVITHLEKSSSDNLIYDSAANDDELEQAATKVQAAFRGYLARRAFWSLKGIIWLQAVVRGQIVRLSGSCPQMLQKRHLQEHLEVEQGLEGVDLKAEDVEAVFELKDYLDERNEEVNILGLTKATITRVQMCGMGDRVCVDLCSLMRPGEGLLVGSFARGLFLVHSDCLESKSNYIASWPFRVNAGPVHANVAIPGGKTCYLSELKAGKEILVVDQSGIQRTAVVGRVKIETRPLIIVDAKVDSHKETSYTILLQNSKTVGLVAPTKGGGNEATAIPVTSLKVGDEVFVRVQGSARHTGIEIQEFTLEK
ncbi:uncharacterized protein LOC111906806 [Lactuca sativa]|uniref:uncharacterized protein LOC111906806 n=1 Tax=Lactuca sativa TaxID=4236 RepID=UPI000CD96E7C|nr:uncharacterized protein LOC111906806 [Lactuca sativa]XP_052626647.1 uncharacterized protein LOC111906806 [Lactuca sativa]